MRLTPANQKATSLTKAAVTSSNERIGSSAPWDLILLHDGLKGQKARSAAWKVLLDASQLKTRLT